MKNLPLVSIIVCTYNGGNRISECLNSLVKQDFDNEMYEVLVVIDGSTDDTLQVLEKYHGIRTVALHKNSGISAARNAGLQNALGDIIAYTDDDCVADVFWLKNLIRHFANNVAAVGGITMPYSTDFLMERYMSETGYGNPAPIEFGKSKNPFYRFFVYLKDMLSPLIDSDADPIPVRSIYTLNASFKKELVKKAGGWISGFNSSEDSEMCDRLNRLFPDRKILYTKKAVIVHKHRTSFWHFLQQRFVRGEDTLKCYIKDEKIPPVFPFPVFVLLISCFALFYKPLSCIILLILLPQVFYFWWLIKFIKYRKWSYLVFPYMQVMLEMATIIGMFRGYMNLSLKK